MGRVPRRWRAGSLGPHGEEPVPRPPEIASPPHLFSLHGVGGRTIGNQSHPPNLESGGRARAEPPEAAVRHARNAAPPQRPQNIANVAIPYRYYIGIIQIVNMYWKHR